MAVGVGVGVGCGLASDAGDTAKQASAAAMSIIADAEVLEDLATRCFCSRSTEVWIRVFISVICFLFGFSLWVLVGRNQCPRRGAGVGRGRGVGRGLGSGDGGKSQCGAHKSPLL